MKKRVGVLLAGCGVFDGAEVHEAVLTLYFLDRAGAEVVIMAPDREQAHVVNHHTGEPTDETRNVLIEAARIARGPVTDVATVSADDLDALVLPGGFGAAKNLCTFAFDGPDCSVDPGVETLVKAVHAAGKPIGALCIAPALVAKLLGADHNVTLTIGNDADTASALQTMGAKHEDRAVEDIVVDDDNRIVSTPCYMIGEGPAGVGAGIDKLVSHLMSWLG